MAWSSDERGNHFTAGRAASPIDPRRRVHRVAERHDLALDVTYLADHQRPGMRCATQTRLGAERATILGAAAPSALSIANG
jgi:hypothetical protein